MEETLMMTPPPPCAIICLPAHLHPKKTPLTLMPITAFQPLALISSTTGSRFSFLRLQMTTSAPALANSTAMERPMPTPPPVTMATFFSRENGDAAMMPPVEHISLGEGASTTRGLYPSSRRRALEAHGPAGFRMNEAQPRGV